MKPVLTVLLAALAVSACGTMKGHEPTRCQGARRPANPNGTVLAPDATPPAPVPAAASAGACAGALR